MRYKLATALVAAALAAAGMALSEEEKSDYSHAPEAQDVIHGAPEYPSEPWLLAAGCRRPDL